MSLRKRAFFKLIEGIQASRVVQAKRQKLFNVMHAWSSYETQRVMFKALKKAIECSKLEQSDVGVRMLRGKKQRSFGAWQGLYLYKKQVE